MEMAIKSSKSPTRFPIYVSIVILLLSTGCVTNKKYRRAYQAYEEQDYVASVLLFDIYINSSLNGAMATQAEADRSEAYFQLGMQAFENSNWNLAKDFLYLANTEKADSKMDICYFELSKIALVQNKIDSTLVCYDKILSELPQSPLIPEILFNRITLLVALDKKGDAYNDYLTLYRNHTNSNFTQKVQPIVDELIPFYIGAATEFKQVGDYDTSLEMFLKLTLHPTSHSDRINAEISGLYYILADIAAEKERYAEAEGLFENAKKFSQNNNIINSRIAEICHDLTTKGDSLLAVELPDEAKAVYETIFIFHENSENAKNAVAKAVATKNNYINAEKLFAEAVKYEDKKKYQIALKSYNQSKKLHNTKPVREKIFTMQNLIRAEKNPLEFAGSIIKKYGKSKILNKINEVQAEQLMIHGDDLVRISGWKVLYSFGQYKYEVRYDIISPDERLYYAWRVDLSNQAISALNKLSKKTMYE